MYSSDSIDSSPPLLLPLFLQGLEEMARAVKLVLMLADCRGGAARPAALLRGSPMGQASGLRFVLQL
jgi:hypothetical protein